jgi:hypothetical protein
MKVTLNLTPEMIFALQVALDELSNSGEWANHLTEDEVETTYEGIAQLRANILER